MDSDVAISVEHVGKKFCRTLRRGMRYGLEDIFRNMVGVKTPEQLRKDEFWAVADANFQVKRGESIGLIGPNGSGKTTLLKMIGGIQWPDRGRIQIRGRVGSLIAVGAGFHPLLTGRENIYVNGAIMGMTKAEIDRQFDAIVDFAAIGDFLDAPVRNYSSGMFVRLGFAVAVHADPRVMLVDEVLAVGDHGFQTKCFKKMGKLREGGTTFVIVSHNMHAVNGFADSVCLLHDGKIQLFEDVADGTNAYNELFLAEGSDEIERLVAEGAHIKFHDVQFGSTNLRPGGTFQVELPWQSTERYEDVEVDVGVYDFRDSGLYAQATNRAFDRRIDLDRGRGVLRIEVQQIHLQGTRGQVAIAVWSNRREEQLFWSRVPVRFKSAAHASGRNLLPMTYDVSPQ